jgi:hypothetical protein
MRIKVQMLLVLTFTILLLSACTVKEVVTTPVATTAPSVTPSVKVSSSPSATTSATPAATKKSTPKASAQPLVDCTGPDGKTIKLTQKACDDFNKSWNKATAAPSSATQTQVTGCGAYNPTGALGTARVTVAIESGQSWVGQAGLNFSEKYPECKGNGLDYTYGDVINGPMTKDFGGLRPGPYKIEITYHGKQWSSDIDLNGGTTNVTVTVSNN